MAWPQITTVWQPHQEMAEAAVEMLIGHDGRGRVKEGGTGLVLPYRIMVRDRCAASEQAGRPQAPAPGTS